MIEPTAASGFGSASDAYERGRPSYPLAAVEFVVQELGIGPGMTVVDVGAGTGKFTRLLVDTGARLVAVEPVAAMRAKLAELVPTAEALDGTGEAIPVADASARAVTVAQAFHWFRHAEALAEMARVLEPGGGMALIWNSRDDRVPWVAEFGRIIRWNAGQIPTYDAGDESWLDRIDATGLYTPAQLRQFDYEQEIDLDGLVDRAASVSYIAAMDEAERAAVLDQVRALAADFPARFALPYVTNVYWCHRTA